MVVTGCFPFSTFRSVRRLELSPRSIYGGLSALAQGYIHGVTSFQTLAGLLGIFFLLCFAQLCSKRGTSVSKAARGFATEVGTSNVKQVNEDPREIRSAVDYPKGVLIAYPGRGSFWSCTPSSILKFRGTPRPRSTLAAGAWAQIS